MREGLEWGESGVKEGLECGERGAREGFSGVISISAIRACGAAAFDDGRKN